MTGTISGAGSTNMQNVITKSMQQNEAGIRKRESVSIKGSSITVKAAGENCILEQYREQGVDLQLTGVQPEEVCSEEELEEQRMKESEQRMVEMYQQQLEAAKENAEAAAEGFADIGRAMEIARRMMKGDIVPASDEKFLMDYNKDIYMGAKNMQAMAQNEDPKKHESVLEEDEESGESASVKVDGGDITIDATSINMISQ